MGGGPAQISLHARRCACVPRVKLSVVAPVTEHLPSFNPAALADRRPLRGLQTEGRRDIREGTYIHYVHVRGFQSFFFFFYCAIAVKIETAFELAWLGYDRGIAVFRSKFIT